MLNSKRNPPLAVDVAGGEEALPEGGLPSAFPVVLSIARTGFASLGSRWSWVRMARLTE
jgi:hypothetical protein